MKQEILDALKNLGGNIDNAKDGSLYEDLLSVTFDTVLYADFHNDFEIWELEKFYNENNDLYSSDKNTFSAKLLDKYFRLTRDGMCQEFWDVKMFTPFKKDTDDYKEWNSIFSDDVFGKCVDLTEIRKITDNTKPDFMFLFESYGFPDSYFICLTDPQPDNPTVFGTDHEGFFREISNRGSLLDFLKNFISKEKFIEIAIEDIEKFYRK